MQLRAPAILVAARQQGETGVIANFLTADHGLVAAYVAGGRGRVMRPVMIPGNVVDMQITVKSEHRLPFAKVELLSSRGQFMTEPLLASAIGWVCALTASALPERQAYPNLHSALGGLLEAICNAPSARGWAGALIGYETLLLREMGYGGEGQRPEGDMPQLLGQMDALHHPIEHYLLAERRGDVMAARQRLRELLGRIEE